jgi:hypothetical protein
VLGLLGLPGVASATAGPAAPSIRHVHIVRPQSRATSVRASLVKQGALANWGTRISNIKP